MDKAEVAANAATVYVVDDDDGMRPRESTYLINGGASRYLLYRFNRIPPMSLPLTLTFRHLPRSGALEASARDVGERLHRLNDGMTGCHIVFEGSPEAAGGVPFRVKIHVSVPGAQIHAESARQPEEGQTAPHNPLRSAYENAKRQLAKLKQSYGRPNLASR